eukprot:COSAG02_NODE_98_length_37150_cov_39.614207_29_plen_154_part_00
MSTRIRRLSRFCTTWLIAADTTSFFDLTVAGLVINTHDSLRHRDSFESNRAFRQEALSHPRGSEHMRRSSMPVKAKWLIHIDRVRKCRHVNLVTRRAQNLPDEQEYLFAPYSAFTVRSARWASGTDDDPHVIELDAAPDNVGPSEDLPLAPWS